MKDDLVKRRGLTVEPTLDDVFLDVTGRRREQSAGDVKEVTA